MSLGYAEKLSFREDLGGKLGDPEIFDDPDEIERKVTLLAELIKNSQSIVAFTGAGVSTSSGIPDFRGPNGIWTLQRAGQPIPKPKVSFAMAKPSFTHAALVHLMKTDKLKYVVSQNVDGLHLRSGIPRSKLAELHGNCFVERCNKKDCRKVYVRDFEVETVGFKPTSRKCSEWGCDGDLHDTVLDWEDELPEDQLKLSEQHARDADLAICLGTSLQITPACNLPLKTIKTYKNKPVPGKLVIINLQRTQHDKRAEESGGLVIHAKTDDVMRLLMQKLNVKIPPYVREETFFIADDVRSKPRETSINVSLRFSGIGSDYPPAMIKSIAYTIHDPSQQGILHEGHTEERPFGISFTTDKTGRYLVKLKFHLHDGADEDKRVVEMDRDVYVQREAMGSAMRAKFISQVMDYYAQ